MPHSSFPFGKGSLGNPILSDLSFPITKSVKKTNTRDLAPNVNALQTVIAHMVKIKSLGLEIRQTLLEYHLSTNYSLSLSFLGYKMGIVIVPTSSVS